MRRCDRVGKRSILFTFAQDTVSPAQALSLGGNVVSLGALGGLQLQEHSETGPSRALTVEGSGCSIPVRF